jgi:hypothetical protein
MSEQDPQPNPEGGAGQAPPTSEEELQRRLEEQLRQVRVQDLLLESVASILNLSARRIGKADERDLDQARVGIEAVRAVVDLLEPGPREQVRDALSQVQMLYARESQGGEGAPGGEGGPPPGGQAPPQEGGGDRPGPGPDRPSGLWTPPGSS